MMIRVSLFCFTIFTLIACLDKEPIYKFKLMNYSNEKFKLVDSTNSCLNFSTSGSYNDQKRQISTKRDQLKEKFKLIHNLSGKDEFLDSVSVLFTELLLNKIVPYWYGTPWDFEGHTSVPNQGEIACGYFVSTTLNHVGLNLNRYHLARQGPYNEARSLAVQTSLILVFSSDSGLKINAVFFSSFAEGLYFIGLDNHVGYLYVYNDHAFFLHSNYIENRVMIEPIDHSKAFQSSSYYIVKITGNRTLMRKWLLREALVVFKE